MRVARDARPFVLVPSLLWVAGCIPYAVGSTAKPTPVGEVRTTGSYYVIPNGLSLKKDSTGTSLPGIDVETRFGVSERADAGVRITSMSGIVASYKMRLDGWTSDGGAATALMLGGGFVNMGQHGELEATLLQSTDESRTFAPYSGLRVVKVFPLSETAVHDAPTAGGFLGVRIGNSDIGVVPEVGVYHDKSALHLRRSNVVVVPSISLYGNPLRAAGRRIRHSGAGVPASPGYPGWPTLPRCRGVLTAPSHRRPSVRVTPGTPPFTGRSTCTPIAPAPVPATPGQPLLRPHASLPASPP